MKKVIFWTAVLFIFIWITGYLKKEKVSDFQNRMNDSISLYKPLHSRVSYNNDFVYGIVSWNTNLWMRCNKFTLDGMEYSKLKTKRESIKSQIAKINSLYGHFRLISAALDSEIQNATIKKIHGHWEHNWYRGTSNWVIDRIEYYYKAQQPYVDKADSLCKELHEEAKKLANHFPTLDKAVEDYVREMNGIARITQVPRDCETPLMFNDRFLKFAEELGKK